MGTTQIRFTKTKEIEEMLKDLLYSYRGMTEAELFKLSFSQFWKKETKRDENGLTPRQSAELHLAINDVKKGETVGPFSSDEALDYLESLSKK